MGGNQRPIGQNRQQKRADQPLHLIAEPTHAVMDQHPLATQRRRIADHRSVQQGVSEQERTDGWAKVIAIVRFVGDGGAIEGGAQVLGWWVVLPIEMTGAANEGVAAR